MMLIDSAAVTAEEAINSSANAKLIKELTSSNAAASARPDDDRDKRHVLAAAALMAGYDDLYYPTYHSNLGYYHQQGSLAEGTLYRNILMYIIN